MEERLFYIEQFANDMRERAGNAIIGDDNIEPLAEEESVDVDDYDSWLREPETSNCIGYWCCDVCPSRHCCGEN